MTKDSFSLVAALLVLSAVLSAGCRDTAEPSAPTTGTLVIQVSTDSADIAVDPGGYRLVIDGAVKQSVAANATVTIAGIATGRHLVGLDGVPSQYAISGNNPRWVYVGTTQASSMPVSFSVSRVTGDCGGCWDY